MGGYPTDLHRGQSAGSPGLAILNGTRTDQGFPPTAGGALAADENECLVRPTASTSNKP